MRMRWVLLPLVVFAHVLLGRFFGGFDSRRGVALMLSLRPGGTTTCTLRQTKTQLARTEPQLARIEPQRLARDHIRLGTWFQTGAQGLVSESSPSLGVHIAPRIFPSLHQATNPREVTPKSTSVRLIECTNCRLRFRASFRVYDSEFRFRI